jgi:hypothetical protein
MIKYEVNFTEGSLANLGYNFELLFEDFFAAVFLFLLELFIALSKHFFKMLLYKLNELLLTLNLELSNILLIEFFLAICLKILQ